MHNSDNHKMALLRELQDREVPLGIYELLEHLPNDFAERSVRRWLSQLADGNFIEKTGLKKATKYQITSPSFGSFRLREERGRCFCDESLSVIYKIERPLIERRPVSYNEKFLESYIPNRSFYLPFKTRAELLRMGKRAKNNEPAGTYARRIFNRLLIDLSYNSSRLEGNTYSLLETEKLLMNGIEAIGKLDDEKTMILNHKEAIRFLVDSAPKLQVTTDTICTLHFLLADGLIDSRDLGVVRSHEVFVGGSRYMPYTNQHKLQQLLDRIILKAALINDPYEQSFFLLVHLSYLQAFADVNKRTSRLSANIPLIKNNLVPLSFNDVKKEDYISALLAVYELQEIRPMIDIYFDSYNKSCFMFDSTVQSVGVDIIRVLYRKQRRTLLAEIILKKKVGPAMDRYIKKETAKLIPKHDRAHFIEDVKEDVSLLNPIRICGLSVTLDEFKAWEKAQTIQ